MSFGDDEARAIGIEPNRIRRVAFLLTSVMVAVAVAYAGLIGFVGLVVPHMVRLRFGPDHRRLLRLSALYGAAFLVIADAAARGAFGIMDTSMPVGAITALFGAPLFIWLLASRTTRIL